MKSVNMEKGCGKTKDLFVGIQVANGSFTGKGNPQHVPNQPGLSRDPEPVVCLDTAVSGARRSGLCSRPGYRLPARSRAAPKCRRASGLSRTTLWATSSGIGYVAVGGGCVKNSLASAPIHQRHAMIERLRELVPAVSVRRLCRLLGINRQWYYEHRRPAVQEGRDQSLSQALHELHRDFAGYGYRRMTKAHKPRWLEDQSQTRRARDEAREPDLPAQTPLCPHDRLQAQRAGLCQFVQRSLSRGAQPMLGRGSYLCASAGRVCVPGVPTGCVFAQMHRVEFVSKHGQQLAFPGFGNGFAGVRGALPV
jgi:hypothetical protein